MRAEQHVRRRCVRLRYQHKPARRPMAAGALLRQHPGCQRCLAKLGALWPLPLPAALPGGWHQRV